MERQAWRAAHLSNCTLRMEKDVLGLICMLMLELPPKLSESAAMLPSTVPPLGPPCKVIVVQVVPLHPVLCAYSIPLRRNVPPPLQFNAAELRERSIKKRNPRYCRPGSPYVPVHGASKTLPSIADASATVGASPDVH